MTIERQEWSSHPSFCKHCDNQRHIDLGHIQRRNWDCQRLPVPIVGIHIKLGEKIDG